MNHLHRIKAYKRREIAAAMEQFPYADLARAATNTSAPRGFRRALEDIAAACGHALIAEFKRLSPSAGFIRPAADPEEIASFYQDSGAAAISVLTDAPSFGGTLTDMARIRNNISLPLLRKDFILDPWQIAESRLWGADCILLIMALLNDETARHLLATATEYQLDVLVEIHDEAELHRALALGATLIGINNRDLTTLTVNLETTKRLAPLCDSCCLIVSESGIALPEEMDRLARNGAFAFLVGESLMRAPDIAAATAQLTKPLDFHKDRFPPS